MKWTVLRDLSNSAHIVPLGGGPMIASIGDDYLLSVQYAHADLIAVAPELLEVVKAMLKDGNQETFKARRERALRIIAKAEGDTDAGN